MAHVRIEPVEGLALYKRYIGEVEPQRVYVSLDAESGTLGARALITTGNIVPVRVWLGHVRRWRIPPLRAHAANYLLEGIRPLAERVCAGYRAVWVERRLAAQFTADASDAIDEISTLCNTVDPGDMVSVWTASHWFAADGSPQTLRKTLCIHAQTTDLQLDLIAQRLRRQAKSQDVDDIEGLEYYLRKLRDGAIVHGAMS